MANRRTHMRQVRQVLRHRHEAGLGQRAIASSLGMSRDAVRSCLDRAKAAMVTWPLPPDLDDDQLDALLFPASRSPVLRASPDIDWAEVHQEMQRKGATLQQLHLEHLESYPGSICYSHYCKRYKTWAKQLKSYMRQSHQPGEKVFVDYAGKTMEIVDPVSGQRRKVQIFVGVLGASNFTYADAHWSQQLPDWIDAHVRMFDYFGAVPKVIVCDNLKSGVTKVCKVDPVINATYQNLAEHYDMVVIPARSRHPKDKAKVEGGVNIVTRWILFRLRKHVFYSLGELRQAIAALLDDLNNRRFQKMPGTRRTAFEAIDRPAMRALPSSRYTYAEFHKVRVGMDKSVHVDQRPYSVPPHLVGKEVELRVTSSTVEVLYGGKRVTSHERGPGTEPAIHPEHLTPAQRYYMSWCPEDALAWAMTVGTHVHAFVSARIHVLTHKERGYRMTNRLKKLAQEFGDQRLDSACDRALQLGTTSLSSLRSILSHRLESQGTGQPDEAAFEHGNLRGATYYH